MGFHMLLLSGFGLLGVWLRYGIGLYCQAFAWEGFPYPTFLINVMGAFLIGVVYVWGNEYARWSPALSISLMTGFLGGFTTFSAFSLETVLLLEKGLWRTACVYAATSVILGIGGAWGGMGITRWYLMRG